VAAVKGDYYDAINVAHITGKPDFVPEGGAKNVARRDGAGTVMLDATLTMKHLPDHYFQAVGSGTGGIAV
jgi:cysteate synthase